MFVVEIIAALRRRDLAGKEVGHGRYLSKRVLRRFQLYAIRTERG
jgi:hypothetical protein